MKGGWWFSVARVFLVAAGVAPALKVFIVEFLCEKLQALGRQRHQQGQTARDVFLPKRFKAKGQGKRI